MLLVIGKLYFEDQPRIRIDYEIKNITVYNDKLVDYKIHDKSIIVYMENDIRITRLNNIQWITPPGEEIFYFTMFMILVWGLFLTKLFVSIWDEK